MNARAEDFTAAWQKHASRVAAYAQRHVGPELAADVVAETFTNAWRRWDDIDGPMLPWLITTARRVMWNEERSTRRRVALLERMRMLGAGSGVARADEAFERDTALRRLASLREDHREALLLIAWDGLTPEQAARVLGIRPATLRARVHRGRKALDAASKDAADHHRPVSAQNRVGTPPGRHLMNVDDETAQVARTALGFLRGPEVDLNAVWAEHTVDRILTSPVSSPRRSRTRRVGVVALAVGTVGLGGVAYAVGGAPLPDVFSQTFSDYATETGNDKPVAVQVADLKLPDGSRYAAWRGVNKDLDCFASLGDWDGREGLNSGWGWSTCTDLTPGQTDANKAVVSWAGASNNDSPYGVPDLYYPVLVGHTTDPRTTQVVVTGAAAPSVAIINETLPVDPTTGSFAAVLPGSDAHPFARPSTDLLTVRFLDSDGTEVEEPANPFS